MTRYQLQAQNELRLRKEGLAEQLSALLTDMIVDGTLPASRALPTERELAGQFSVGMSVVREAIKSLAAMGLVEVRHGVGTFVNPSERWETEKPMLLLVRKESKAVLDVHEVRTSLELTAVERAARTATTENLDAVESALQNMTGAAEDREAVASADLEFHLAIARAGGNRVLLSVLRPLILPIHDYMYRISWFPAAAPRALSQHREILDAIRAHDPLAATDAMQRHMETTRRELLELINQSNSEASGNDEATEEPTERTER